MNIEELRTKIDKIDSEILLSNILKVTRENLLLNLDKKISHVDLKNFVSYIKKARGTQYLTISASRCLIHFLLTKET